MLPRRFAALGVFLLATASLAGCLGGAGDAKDSTGTGNPTGNIEATQEVAPPAKGDNATGAIEGSVVNENAAPIGNAFVILVGSRNSTTTDRFGHFSLSFVEPDEYVLRVDADTYRPLESAITITAGTVTRVNITLVPMVDRGSGFREHLHDFWADETSKVLFDGTVRYKTSGTGGQWFCGFGVSAGMTCPATLPVDLPQGLIVYPGTASIDVTITWSNQDYLSEAGFRYMAANETKFLRGPLVFKSGQTHSFPVGFEMADHGHQTVTMWQFQILTDSKIAGQRFAQNEFNARFVAPFQVKIVANKGIVPAEPAHTAFWTNSSSILLADRLLRDNNAIPGNPQQRNPNARSCGTSEPGYATCSVLPAGVIVPPGTTRLLVTLEVAYGQAALASVASAKTVIFRTAAVNPAHATWNDFLVVAPTKSGGKSTYEVKLEPKDADAFYQKKSLWLFSFANEGKEKDPDFTNECPATCGGTKLYLTVVAVNDDFVASS